MKVLVIQDGTGDGDVQAVVEVPDGQTDKQVFQRWCEVMAAQLSEASGKPVTWQSVAGDLQYDPSSEVEQV